jgi:hypothetical protein
MISRLRHSDEEDSRYADDNPTCSTPAGLPALGTEESQRALAQRRLARFGPAPADDPRWWTGWNQTTVRRALSSCPIEEVDLHGQTGIALSACPNAVTMRFTSYAASCDSHGWTRHLGLQ